VGTAAATVEATRSPLLDELEQMLVAFSSLAKPAQLAVTAVAQSLAEDDGVTEAERDLSTAVLVLALALR
jgi:hypothetical protein